MDCNQITYKNSLIYRIYCFINRRKVSNEFDSSIKEKCSEEISIEVLENCNNPQILRLFKKIIPYRDYVSIYLHGSWADNTNNSFSDIDDFVVLNLKELKKNKNLKTVISILNQIDMKFCRIDPLQHHGHWIVCSSQLKAYNNSFMPLYIMKEAKKIMGESNIKAVIDSKGTKEGLKNNIRVTCENISNLSEKYFNNKINAYELKCLIGSFVLVPAFIYQLMNQDFTKPEAIAKSNKIFSKSAHSCILWATKCRENWNVITNKTIFKGLYLLAYFCTDPHLWRRFSSKYSFKINSRDKPLLSSVELSKWGVESYMKETLNYLSDK